MSIDARSCASSPPTVGELSALYLKHAHTYYRRRHTGEQTREAANIASALKRFTEFAGAASPAGRINRHQVRAWLDQLAAADLSRGYCNACLARLRRFIRWAVDLDYLPAGTLSELAAVRPFAAHRSAAKEPPPRQPAVTADVRRVLAFLQPMPRDVLQLVLLTGARPSELLDLSNAEVHADAHGARLVPLQHKTAHKGKHRVIPLSPAALAIVERHWRPLCPGDALFPAPRSVVRAGYSIEALRAAIRRACTRAGVQPFVPYQVRRATAEDVRQHITRPGRADHPGLPDRPGHPGRGGPPSRRVGSTVHPFQHPRPSPAILIHRRVLLASSAVQVLQTQPESTPPCQCVIHDFRLYLTLRCR